MNYTRALGFAVIVYVIGAVVLLLSGYRINAAPSMLSYGILWVLMIPVFLIVAKWYFHVVPPTAKAGLFLGLMTVVVGFLLDTGIVLVSGVWGSLSDFYATVYGDWRFVVTLIEMLLLTSYAGYEFDSTYTSSGKVE
ncbi:MAG: hypothetical protein COU32_00010 [Candidatus Magasanikbacteria bacterium CG10_big_fil_rev_8_21_14_0_10_42_10]|uniref:DUF5367 domain-containing protein n=2 Tax=Candidatus Magasanikiibacteriota TaxID=1752731 RepID=A0A2H0TZ76_9BACT|nr:MAG: hypothetical protein COU32_00010 [Candidatus Magasanikbacteria bacterium CG10_big_fil_rev_8_21_14_0_10_42_10]PIZ93080.1 MAG: hypothetical protein COX82_03375 [Candidatus Magasanikbacteria bacterium CG_4_10_14_0_2_um_filter_41_10]